MSFHVRTITGQIIRNHYADFGIQGIYKLFMADSLHITDNTWSSYIVALFLKTSIEYVEREIQLGIEAHQRLINEILETVQHIGEGRIKSEEESKLYLIRIKELLQKSKYYE